MTAENQTLLIVLTLAVLAPVIVELIPRVAIPAIVLEIVLGILVGPQVLQWAEPNQQLELLSRYGMTFLFFLAGLEIDFAAIRGRPIAWAGLGWLVSVGLAMAAGCGLQAAGVIVSGLVVATAFTTTALGALIPILRDSGTLNSKFGAFVSAAGAVGEFGPVVMISVALSREGGSKSVLFIAAFAGITLSCAYFAATARPMPAIRLLKRKLHTSAQLPIRVSLLVLAALIVITKQFGLDSVLGAIAAGVVVSLACRGHDGEAVRHKLEAIGFGFFIPMFFIATGIKFDLHALTATPAALLRVPLFLGMFLVARGVPVWLCRRDLPRGDWLPLALMSSTA
ncbi:MAG: cation:proton antiporter, partial [Planctomycetales bacterium]|nr:cation:proton antiporter [Planctomycetales bacterium]